MFDSCRTTPLVFYRVGIFVWSVWSPRSVQSFCVIFNFIKLSAFCSASLDGFSVLLKKERRFFVINFKLNLKLQKPFLLTPDPDCSNVQKSFEINYVKFQLETFAVIISTNCHRATVWRGISCKTQTSWGALQNTFWLKLVFCPSRLDPLSLPANWDLYVNLPEIFSKKRLNMP